MTDDDKNLIFAIAFAIRESPAGRRLSGVTAHELAVVAHHAIKDRLPRETK